MKHALCSLIAAAPACHVSSSDPAWRRAAQLENEARTTEQLIWTLLLQYNSAVEPQATAYCRISRLHDRAQARSTRRAIASSIAMYRFLGYTPDRVSTSHVFYPQIVAALSKVSND